ncbi:MAG TPA: TolC family protein [Burkholderiales bacterium]|nr:TolC family protein [Burkholderiales bacterium]
MRSRYIYAAFAACIVVSGVRAAAAQTQPIAPDIVDLPAVMRLVRDASPRLAAERQTIVGAQADRITAGAYPNPTASFGRFRQGGGQATIFEGSHQDQVTFDVPVLVAGQRAARIERAERGIEAARARVALGASTLSAEAAVAFVGLLAAQEKQRLLGDVRQEIVRLRDIIAGREKSGVASRYDVTRFDVELAGFDAKVGEAGAEVADRTGDLAVLLGLPQWRPRAAGDLAPLRLDRFPGADAAVAAAKSPAIVAATREAEAARSGVEVARRERWPVPSVNFGRSWTSDPFGSANFLGLTVELPIFDTRRGALARAAAEAHSAELRRDVALGEAAANLQRYADMIARRQVALERFDQDAWARLPSLARMAEDAYRLGRGSILELLDATRSRSELQQTRIDIIAALLAAQLRLLATTGDLNDTVNLGAPAAR